MLVQTILDLVAGEEILPLLIMDGLTMRALTRPHLTVIPVFLEAVMGLYSLLSNIIAVLRRQFRVVSSKF
jgi:hypothetical protein